MKTEIAPTTNPSTTTIATTTARIVSTGAVVCIEELFEFIRNMFILRFRKKQINMMILKIVRRS